MAPVLALMGIDAVTSGSIIAMGALLGMIAPPVNTAALIICAGIDVPYVGFEGPLALITFPLAILFVLLLGYKQARHMDYEKLPLRSRMRSASSTVCASTFRYWFWLL